MKLKEKFKNIIFSFIIVTLFFGALELQQRIRYYVREKDEYYLFYGGGRAIIFLKKCYYNILALFEEKKEKRDLTIAALGGSTTYWAGSPENSYIAQLGLLLKERFPSRNFEVYNWGRPASTSDGDFENLREELSRLPVERYPDILIIHTGINDAYISLGYSKDWDSVYHPWPVRLNHVLMHYSLLYRCIYERFHDYNVPLPKYRIATGEDYERQVDYFVKRLRKNLSGMLVLCAANNIDVIISTHPLHNEFWNTIKKEEKRYVDAYRKMCNEIVSVAKEKNIILVDLRELMKEDITYFRADLMHFELSGSKKAAAIFLPVIAGIAKKNHVL